MLTVFAATLIPLVTACQILALGLLWRRYRLKGSGWWLVATILICLGTAAQAVEETGWRPLALVATVNAVCLWGAMTEYLAARVLTGGAIPGATRIAGLMALGLGWALTAAWQADRHPGDLLLYGLLRAPCNLLIAVAEIAIAVSLLRLSRQSGTYGGRVTAAGYLLTVATLPAYPLSFLHPWLRTAGMVVAAAGFVLVGSGLLMLLMERRHQDLLAGSESLAQEASAQAARADVVAQEARSHAHQLSAVSGQAELGVLAVDLAKDLLSSVDVLRLSSTRLQGGTPPVERDALTERIERVLRDLSMVATGVLATEGSQPVTPSRVDARKMLERLLADLVPPTIGVMKAWPGPQVWLTVDETLLSVALHQLIRCQLLAEPPVTRLSVILTITPELTVTLQQALVGRSQGEPPVDAVGMRLAQLAIRRLGGRLEMRAGPTGTTLVMTLPAETVGPAP